MLDKLIIEFDKIVQTLWGVPVSRRPHPDAEISLVSDTDDKGYVSDKDRAHIIGLMRVNHCGEVCAQGLYQGQALTSKDEELKIVFSDASYEETEHLAWLETRINQLGGHVSILNPLFYLGSLGIGLVAGVCGDKWSLGFLEETERQVEAHLRSHLDQIPENDNQSRAIIIQMIADEAGHAEMAHNYGAAQLPEVIKMFMRLSSKIMTKTTYCI